MNKTYNGLQEAKHCITELLPKEEQGRYHKEIFDAIDEASKVFESESEQERMNKEVIDRLEYCETAYDDIETWHDPVTDDYYHVPIKILRDFDNIEKL